MTNEKKDVLDVTFPNQEKSKELLEIVAQKKFKVTIRTAEGKIRYMYLDDSDNAQGYCDQVNATIMKIEKL